MLLFFLVNTHPGTELSTLVLVNQVEQSPDFLLRQTIVGVTCNIALLKQAGSGVKLTMCLSEKVENLSVRMKKKICDIAMSNVYDTAQCLVTCLVSTAKSWGVGMLPHFISFGAWHIGPFTMKKTFQQKSQLHDIIDDSFFL